MNEMDPMPDVPADALKTWPASDLDLARGLGRVIGLAARKLGIPYDQSTPLDQLCHAILALARGGRLDPDAYRLVWWVVHAPTGITCVHPTLNAPA